MNQVEKLSLRYRRYLGPTSLPADLALIMANMGGVSTGSVVLDPFCGTGSILVACSARGARYGSKATGLQLWVYT